jgi:ABC-2 type transport system permease protein
MILPRLHRRAKARRAARRAARGLEPRRPADSAAGLILHQAQYDLRAFRRNRQARFFTVALPVIFLVIFVSIFGNNHVGLEHVKASTYYVPGIAALAVIASSFVNLVISITTQRETGVLKRRRSTPMPAWALIGGRTLAAVVVSLIVMAIVIAIGAAAYGVKLPRSTIPGVVLTALVGAISFSCLAYALSTFIANADAAQPTVQAIMLPLYFISGVFITNANLPAWLRDVAKVFPVEHLASGLHHAFDPATHGSGIVWSDIGVLVLWAAIGLAVALRRFSWMPAFSAG